MATELENLETARANIAALLATVTASPKPTVSIDGKTVSWESYVAMLNAQWEKLNLQIQTLGGPLWLTTVGVP